MPRRVSAITGEASGIRAFEVVDPERSKCVMTCVSRTGHGRLALDR